MELLLSTLLLTLMSSVNCEEGNANDLNGDDRSATHHQSIKDDEGNDISRASNTIEEDRNNMTDEELNESIYEERPWIAQYKIFGGGNPRKTTDGEDVVDGDIVIPNKEEEEKEDDPENEISGKKATSETSDLWDDARVYYTFHHSIDKVPGLEKLIEQAIDHWSNNTCIKFERVKFINLYYLRFRHDKDGCYSFIGKKNALIGQDVSIGEGCEYFHTIIHEIGHAIGFYHEQSRRDRDKYAVLLTQNINYNMLSQFALAHDQSYGVEYDFGSEMHYPPEAFSNRIFEKNTLVTKNPHNQRLIGKYNGLTFRDRKIANTLYNCNEKCSNRQTVTCQNQGYLRPVRNQPDNCFCDCPPRASGEFCETLEGDYYDNPMCGGNVTEPGVIQTPNYPERKTRYEDCSWWIQAPAGKNVQVTFLDFSFDRRLNRPEHPLHGLCVFERVEIRTEDRYDGTMYCAQDIPKGKVMTSKGNEFIILITANQYRVGKGLQANVTFV